MVVEGETVMLVPEPMEPVPHPVLYHCQLVALFKLPEATDSVVLFPLQIVEFVAAKVGTSGGVQGIT